MQIRANLGKGLKKLGYFQFSACTKTSLWSKFSIAQVVALAPLVIVWGKTALELMMLASNTGGSARGLGFLQWVATSDVAASRPATRRLFLGSSALLGLAAITVIVLLTLTDPAAAR